MTNYTPGMHLASVLTPLSDDNLQLAAQCGVEGVVLRYPANGPGALHAQFRRVKSFGLRVPAVEGWLPIERIKLGLDDGTELQALQELIRRMGDMGIPVLCYNFMAGSDWCRTKLDATERGGAKVTAFAVADAEHAVRLGYSSANPEVEARARQLTPELLWEHLERLLTALLPVAEQSGVTLAMHPDDPPLPSVLGRPRIMCSVRQLERLVTLAPSRANAICFCQGTFAAMGVDVPATIRRLGPHIRYVHFRDVRGTPESFTETFHDNGPTDMAAAMRAYRDIGFAGFMRPDHVPQLAGEEFGEPGYTILGRLFAWGYMRGLMQATEEDGRRERTR